MPVPVAADSGSLCVTLHIACFRRGVGIALLSRLPLLGEVIPLGIDVLLRDLFLLLLLDLGPSCNLVVLVYLADRLIEIGSRLGP